MPKTTHTPGSLCWFELASTDLGAAKNFYTSIFPWAVNDMPMGPSEVYTIFRVDGQDAAAAYTMPADQRSHGVPPNWMPYIMVKSADESTARARALGATVHKEPFDVMDQGRMSVVQDPQGAMFCLWEKKKSGGTGITAVDGTAVWADLSTTDQAAGAKFYGDLFGWKMVEGESMRPAKPGSYYHIVSGKEFIGGVPPAEYRQNGMPSHWMLYFQVPDCDGTVARVSALGGRVLLPTQTMGNTRKYAVLADPQGATFAIVQTLAGGQESSQRKAANAAKAKPAKAAKAKKAPAKKAAKKAPAKKAAKAKAKAKPKKVARPAKRAKKSAAKKGKRR